MTLLARRPRMIAAAAATGVAALALAAWGLAPRTDAEGRAMGPRMAISLVAPKEPEVVPGGILEVGTLNDGFDRAALDRVAEIDDPTWMPPDAYAGPDDGWTAPPRMPMPRPIAVEDFPAPPPRAADRDPLRDGSRWFGLDRMRDAMADARADRRQRRAERDAMIAQREMMARRDYAARPPWADRPVPRDRYDDRPRYDDAPRYQDRPGYEDADERASPPSSGPRPYYSSDDDYGPE